MTAALSVPAEAGRRYAAYQISRQPNLGDPLTIVVSLGQQRLHVYDSHGLVASSPISSGTRSNPTPTGIFSVLEKNRVHHSNLYYGAPMPNMQRLTWSGVALHAGVLPGYPASHGCIRLPHAFSKQLFSMTNIGTRVIVNDDMVEPDAFEHPFLFAALPPGKAAIPSPVRRPDPNGVQSAATGVGSVSAMLGVTPAAAAEAAIELASKSSELTGLPLVRTRAMALAERQAEIDKHAALIVQREGELQKAIERITELGSDLKARRVALKDAQNAIRTVDRDAKKAEGFEGAARRRLADFIKSQQREMERAAKREEQRREAHAADAASDRSADELLKRAEARQAEAQADAKSREEAATREGELETELLDRMHEAEAAVAATVRQRTTVTTMEADIKRVDADLVAARKDHVARKQALEDARAEHKRAIAVTRQFEKPATVLISRATGKIYVRQGFEDVYEAPVTFKYPNSDIGTHVFTAKTYKDESQTSLVWHAMTLTELAPKLPPRRRGKHVEQQVVDEGAPRGTARNALDRIEMSDEARHRIVELVKPGSTLIVSDARISRETGKGTDIIIEH
ncbi:MAG: L,D-transpeptidase family protein [Hyphomicrobiaceae bacterium]